MYSLINALLQDAKDGITDEQPQHPTPNAPPPQPWQSHQSEIQDLLKDDEVTHFRYYFLFIYPTFCKNSLFTQLQDMSRYCHNPDVSHLLAQRWDGPHLPATPMEQLVGMGFADRTLNAQLLEKHQDCVEGVLNELLDRQD